MNREELQKALFSLQDEKYREMQLHLIPNISPDVIIGVRTPELRKLAKEIEDAESFKKSLPHDYFEENQVHSFLLERSKDFDATISDVEAFLPYVDNWATCDQLRPKVFRKHRQELLPHIQRWLASEHPYSIRFGIGMLMSHYLDADFDSSFPEMAVAVQNEDYYVKMMVAWYFATALSKQYDAILPFISEYRLDKWMHNKAIQKAVESFRITPEQKAILKQYRIK